VQFFDQTPYRVKTLRIVIIEALSRHTDLPPVESREMADDLQAYIAWWGDGQPLHPGISPEGRPPEEDLVELEIAITRGRSIFHRETPLSCIYCHSIDSKGDSNHPSIKDVFLWFPRYSFQEQRVVSFDTYLLEHCQKYNLVMSTEELVDIAAYLADLSSGNFLRPGSSLNVVENIR
jgi:cytochrome c